MTDRFRQPKGRNDVLSLLNVAIGGLNLTKEATTVTLAKTVRSPLSAFFSLSFKWVSSQITSADYWLMCDAGLDGLQSGLRRNRVYLRRHLRSP